MQMRMVCVLSHPPFFNVVCYWYSNVGNRFNNVLVGAVRSGPAEKSKASCPFHAVIASRSWPARSRFSGTWLFSWHQLFLVDATITVSPSVLVCDEGIRNPRHQMARGGRSGRVELCLLCSTERKWLVLSAHLRPLFPPSDGTQK
jgi:hypothetical protein